MNRNIRSKVLEILIELSKHDEDMRLGQWLNLLCTTAGDVEARPLYDIDDEELLAAGSRFLDQRIGSGWWSQYATLKPVLEKSEMPASR